MQTSVDRPRFRQDLVAEPLEDGGAKFIDVMDPDSGQLFRFYEVEYSLACAMDGERDVAGIVKWAEEELGLKPSANEVRTVVATLGDLGFLERGATMAAAANAAAAAEAPRTVEAPPAAAAPVAEAPKAKTPATGVKAKTPAGGVPATNRWDQPTAMGDVDDYLEPGVVAGSKRPATPVADVELGSAGARGVETSDNLPKADSLELGAPGTTSKPAAAPAKRGEDIALGASGAAAASNVSTDLAADMAVSPADVKEAVRASQVMKSVDVPPELAAELESKPAAAAKAEAKPATKAETKPAAKPEATKPSEAKPAAKPEATKPAEAKPAAKPETKKPVEAVPAKAPPAPARGTSPILIGLLVLAVLAAGGFLVYKYVLKKDDTAAKATPPVEPPKPVEPPPPPPVETAKLATEQPAAEDIKPTSAATVATIVANDTAVKAGEPIARLVGYKPLETETASLQKDVDKLKADIATAEKDRDAAQTAGNKQAVTTAENKLAAYTKQLTTKESSLATKTAALDKLLIKAPADGKVTAVAKANAKVTPTDIIATLTREPILVATFTSAGEVQPNAKVLLAIKDSEQKLSCTVVATGGDGTKIACPAGAAPEGTEVSYAGVDPSAPSDTGTGNETGTGTGSATGETPTAPTETGSAAAPEAGSAAPTDTPAETPPAEKAEKPAQKKAAPARRPRPQPKQPAEQPADKLFPPNGGEKPADPPAEKPAEPAPAPAPTE